MEQETLQPLSDSQMEALEWAVSAYQGQHTEDTEAYLDARGIGLRERLGFRLGVVGGKDIRPDHARYAGMLAIPYLDKDGRPLSLRFRCLQTHDHREKGHGKYNSLAGEIGRMFNIKAIHQPGDEVHVTEGEAESIILTKLGYSAVGIPGAQAWRPHHRRMLAGFSKVYVWGDPDEAGMEFGRKVSSSIRGARVIIPTLGDVNETYLLGGPEAITDLIERA